MTAFAWSTMTSGQSVGFTAADSIAFDPAAGSTARAIAVAVGPAFTSFTYAGKTFLVPNDALTGQAAQLRPMDGSILWVEAAPGAAGPGASTLSARDDIYIGGFDSADGVRDWEIFGGDGHDILLMGDGTDTARGEGDADSINGNSGADEVFGGVGTDSLFGGHGDDSIDGGDGTDSLSGNVGADILRGGNGEDSLFGGFNSDSLDGDDGADSISGDLGDDDLRGSAGNDTLIGGYGNDLLDGGTDNDSLRGEDGDDVMTADSGNDTVSGGEGGDLILRFNFDVNATSSLAGDGGNDTLDSFAGSNTIFGGDGDDLVEGGLDSETIDGGSGDDSIVDAGGSNRIDGGGGNDTLAGGACGCPGAGDTMSGGAGDDLIGLSFNPNLVTAGAGADTIALADFSLFGFSGDSGTDAGLLDVITDFTSGEDKLALRSMSAVSYNEFGSVFASYEAATRAAANSAGLNAVVAAQVGGDIYLFIDSAGDGGAFEDVVKLAGVTYAGIGAGDVVV